MSQFVYVYTCFDPKIRRKLMQVMDERFGPENYFWDADPGAEKNLASPSSIHHGMFVVGKIMDANTLHPLTAILIVGHSNCGKYRLSGYRFSDTQEEEKTHEKDLRAAVAFIRRHLPTLATLPIEICYWDKENEKMVWCKKI